MKKLNKCYIIKNFEGRYITPYGFSGVGLTDEAIKFHNKKEVLEYIRNNVGYGHFIIEKCYEVYNGI